MRRPARRARRGGRTFADVASVRAGLPAENILVGTGDATSGRIRVKTSRASVSRARSQTTATRGAQSRASTFLHHLRVGAPPAPPPGASNSRLRASRR